MHNVIEVTTN